MVIISYKLDNEMQKILSELTDYTANLYRNAGDYMKVGRWMMIIKKLSL